MRIGQAGDEGATVKIDNAGVFAAKSLDICDRSNENDSSILNGDSLGLRLFRVEGVDVGVGEDHVHIFGPSHVSRRAAHKEQNSSGA
jgi:hypothetical protein